jgi:hypothetical protein
MGIACGSMHPCRENVITYLRCLQEPAGMQQLLSDVCSTPDSSAALAFLARVLKANGAEQQTLQLYRKAVQLHPDSSSYALGLAHALELDHDYAAVLQVLLGYCQACEGKCLGPLQLKVRGSDGNRVHTPARLSLLFLQPKQARGTLAYCF